MQMAKPKSSPVLIGFSGKESKKTLLQALSNPSPATPSKAPDRCYVCGMPMRSLTDDAIAFALYGALFLDQDRMGDPSFALLHGFCYDRTIRSNPYWFELARIVKKGDPKNPYDGGGDSLHGWIAHMKKKDGWWSSMEEGLRLAHTEAVRLSRT